MFSTATKDSANAVKDDVKSTYYNAKRDVRENADGTQDNITDIANKAGRKVRGYLEEANDQIGEAAGIINDEIHTNPVRSTLIALGVGYVLGALFRR
jgi:ElaB/YqjD/DUF883 family membrane-anchored ribosome-binding protein